MKEKKNRTESRHSSVRGLSKVRKEVEEKLH